MKTLSKALVGTVAAAAVAVSSATPAVARDRYEHGRGGIDGGDIVAGALVIGGIAAIAAAASNNNDRYDGRYDNRYGDRYGAGYGRGGNPRGAIEQCVRTAERNASRYSYGRADVTDVRDVRQTRWGYEVKGRIAVNTNGRDWRRGDGNYGRGWNNDYRGWDSSLRGYDSGNFKCRVERGRVVDIDYSGIRGL
ncbi:hypothetical protein GGQ88_002018 [Novosphingobium hassiacum]|uniref:17 kDa surface antigen n=1 Tax=Novosphingobium hassiacum TaxID=173676 RepID=A0A7W6EWE5_9SPHN|nr:hypothetical protein [Novosphingobium hassiacum]MBB3860749.1 hypothetical protein [Novosphingobium hassiacum]